MNVCRTIPRLALHCATVICPVALAAQSYISAEDEAYYENYQDGWQTGDWSGRGFKDWRLFAPQYVNEEEEQYAGFFIADAEQEEDLSKSAREGKAFGIFANGTGFEETVAFRAFERPLNTGDVFSLRFEFDGFGTKFERDAEEISSVGVALRTTDRAEDLSELTEGRALVLAVIEGLSTYQILDAAGRFNTRVFIDQDGVEIGLKVVGGGRYDLQLMTLSDEVVHSFTNRQMKINPEVEEEEAVPSLRSFALFNLNGGANNAYFGAFQISRQEGGDL